VKTGQDDHWVICQVVTTHTTTYSQVYREYIQKDKLAKQTEEPIKTRIPGKKLYQLAVKCAGSPFSLMDSRKTVEPIRKLAYRHIAGDDPSTQASEPIKTWVLDKQFEEYQWSTV
jgi:hypothetical protein